MIWFLCSAGEDQVFTRIENNQDIANKIYQQVDESGVLEQGLIQMHKEFSPKLSYDMEKQHILKVKSFDSEFYFVYYPLLGGEKSSNYIVTINNDGEVLETQLILGLKNKNGQIHSIIQINGETKIDAQVSDSGKIVSGYKYLADGSKVDLAPKVGIQSFWSCMNNCLASQAVAAWAITVLGILCAAGCAATAGLACYACLAAADIGAGAAVGYCLAQCD